MSLLTHVEDDTTVDHQRIEIRALAVRAAATLHAGIEPGEAMTKSERENAVHRTLMTARMLEGYIEEGTWAGDPEAEVQASNGPED